MTACSYGSSSARNCRSINVMLWCTRVRLNFDRSSVSLTECHRFYVATQKSTLWHTCAHYRKDVDSRTPDYSFNDLLPLFWRSIFLNFNVSHFKNFWSMHTSWQTNSYGWNSAESWMSFVYFVFKVRVCTFNAFPITLKHFYITSLSDVLFITARTIRTLIFSLTSIQDKT